MAHPGPVTVKVALLDGTSKAMRFAADTTVSECIASIAERDSVLQGNKEDLALLYTRSNEPIPMRHEKTLAYYDVKKDVRGRILIDRILRHARALPLTHCFIRIRSR